MQQYVLGTIIILIGLINIVIIGLMGKTWGSWSAGIKERNPRLYKWMYIIGGVICVAIGTVYLINGQI